MATITKRGRSWTLNWSENGKQHRHSLGPTSADEARRSLKAKEAHLAGYQVTAALNPAGNNSPLFRQFVEEYLNWYYVEYPHSYDRVESICDVWLVDYFGDTQLSALTKKQVESYKAYRPTVSCHSHKKGELPPPPRAETIIKELRVLQAIVNKSVEWELIAVNPIKGVKGPKSLDSKPPRWYSVEELQAIYAASPENAAIWRLLANTGLRRGEAFNLIVEKHISPDSILIVSTEESRTKSGKWRKVPLNPGARAALKALSTQGHLLPRMHPFSLSRSFRRGLKRAGLDGSLHCLRHTYCSHLVMAGIPLRTVQFLAGHASITTTEKYAHLSPDHIAKAAATLAL